MIIDAGQPVRHVHQALLLTGRQYTRLWNHNFGQFWVNSHLGFWTIWMSQTFLAILAIMCQLDVAGILDTADTVDKFDIVFNAMILSTILTILSYFDILGIVDNQWTVDVMVIMDNFQ